MTSERSGDDITRLDGGTATAGGWAREQLRCRCGAALTRWHSRTRARELIRLYGDADRHVVACPACIQARDGNDDKITTVSRAVIKRRRTQAGGER